MSLIRKNSLHIRKKYLLLLPLILFLSSLIIPFNGHAQSVPTNFPFIASIDTMKESRDTETSPLPDNKIVQDVNLAANLHTTHITVATNWDYTDYFRRWVKAIHATGKSVWVRGHPNQWENNNGATGIMTPTDYEAYERNFILQNADVFKSGDIFDTCSEPEQGHYWKAMYPTWTTQTNIEYNQFLRDSTDVADAAFAQKGINGVVTTVHSTNAWIAMHRLDQATLAKMKMVTIDSYPDQYDTDISQAVTDRLNEISEVYNAVHVPIVLGELGYSNKILVSDSLQEQVLQAEFSAIAQLPYIIGMNYWVGPGGPGHGGYTNVFTDVAGQWVLRPAATDLSNFFQSESTKNISLTSQTSYLQNTSSCPQVPSLSVQTFCYNTNTPVPLTRAMFSWNTQQIPGAKYTILYGRQYRNISSVTNASSPTTVPQSTTYGLYSDGSVYSATLMYYTQSCGNQSGKSVTFVPQKC